MIPWIQVYSNLPTHPKTSKLAEELKLSSAYTSPNLIAVGILVGIWTWAIQNAYDGDLSSCSPAIIADACRWKKKPEQLISALKKSGFLDDTMHLHDWEEYAVLIMDAEDNRREKTRDRVKRYREKKRNADVTECNGYSNDYGNVTDTPCNAPTIPDITIPNQTIDIKSGGGDTRAHEEARKIAEELFAAAANRKPNKYDISKVMMGVIRVKENESSGKQEYSIDKNALDLLKYAFEVAAQKGKGGDWSYIGAILSRLALRGIHTIDEAYAYDASHDADRLDKI